MAFVPYEVTPEDGLRLIGATPGPTVAEQPPTQLAGDERPAPDDSRPFMGLHNIVQELVAVGCYECEVPLTAAAVETECAGQPPGKLAYVNREGGDAHPGERSVRGGNVPPGTLAGIGRNEPCPCGSGLKYKRCCGG